MFLPESDVTQWKEDLKRQDFQRKNAAQDVMMKTQFSKPVTWRDVKQKEAEYHPILQKFSQAERENNTRVMEDNTMKHKADLQRKTIEKYLPEYNIINLEKDQTMVERATRTHPKPKQQITAQVNYNIITNQDFAGSLNTSETPTKSMKKANGTMRDFNIISNQYLMEHDSKQEADKKRIDRDIHARYMKTHDYNLLSGEYYDKKKEEEYQEKRVKTQKDHGKDANDKLPPTIKNRETIIFDPTREVPDAIKALDQKKKDAMKKYEVRYKVENQMKERDVAQQDRAEEMKMKRIYDKKFTEHIDKGFDIITMDDYETSKLSYVPKPSNTKWEKLRLTSNNSTQVQQPLAKTATEKSTITASDLRQPRSPEVSPSHIYSSAVRGTSLPAWKDAHSSEIINTNTDFNRMKEYKTSYQRAKEPVYNLADKYNQYCVKPTRVVDDFNTRTLPQIRVADNTLKFSMGQTRTFKRADATAKYRDN